MQRSLQRILTTHTGHATAGVNDNQGDRISIACNSSETDIGRRSLCSNLWEDS